MATTPARFRPGASYVLDAFCKDFCPANDPGRSEPLFLQVRSLDELTISEDHPAGEAFAALMVCADADEACPFVPGADARFAIPFEDPKAFDGTDLEAAMYDERCRQIATELFFVFEYVLQSI